MYIINNIHHKYILLRNDREEDTWSREGKKEDEYLRIECRMYEEKYPKINQLVMVYITL